MEAIMSMSKMAAAACGMSMGLAAWGQVVPATLVAQVGQVAPGGGGATITTVSTPFVTESGQVGFVGALSSGTNYVWSGSGIIWTNAQAMGFTLSGAETGSMGVADGGKFVYSPSIDGLDGIWTHGGYLVRQGDPAPGAPGKFLRANSRPAMYDNGAFAFVSTLTDSAGSSTVTGRGLFFCTGTTPASCTCLIRSGDSVGGFPLGINPGPDVSFDHDLSDDTTQRIQLVRLNYTPGVSTETIIKNNTILHRVGDAVTGINSGTIGGGSGSAFSGFSVDNAGNTLVGCRVNSLVTLLYNGSVVASEGFAIVPGEIPIGSTFLIGAGLNGCHAVHAWSYTDINLQAQKAVYVTLGGDFATGTTRIARVGDLLDFDANGIADARLRDIPTPLHRNLDVGANTLYLSVELEDPLSPGVLVRNAIVGFALAGTCTTTGCDSVDFNNDGLFPDTADIDDFLSVFGGGPCSNDPNCNDVDFNNDGLFPDTLDIDSLLSVFGGGACL
jgi:hypothetical protein